MRWKRTKRRGMDRRAVLRWLREENPAHLRRLFALADLARNKNVGDAVYFRGLVEISNICRRACGYCGISRLNKGLKRYRMTKGEILACARKAVRLGYGTVVLQAGEDPGIKKEWLSGIIRKIKSATPLAVTLSLGERRVDELRAWKKAGADRYLLRFETSDKRLYRRIHPRIPGRLTPDRMRLLKTLRKLGYETGSGIMIGIPCQTYASLARDILLFRSLDLDMIGVGPYLPHPRTPLGKKATKKGRNQVPNSEEMTYKVIALTRLVRPDANIPSTTALATINKVSGREKGLSRGANIVMPNLTPVKYRKFYEIYPGKACLFETAVKGSRTLTKRILSLGRSVGKGPGGRKKT
jgi:biotin synthase